MLTGMDQDLFVLAAQGWRDRRGLDELRSVADDGENPQGL
jgi:hypothetical protein